MEKKILEINCKKIFFDFDGVIVDSNSFKEKAIIESINNLNLEKRISKEAISYFNENAGIGREKKLLKFFGKEIVDKILLDYSQKCLNHFTKVKPTLGCLEFLEFLKKKFPEIKLYILSGGNLEEILLFLKSNNMGNIFHKILHDNFSKKDHLINEKAEHNDLFFGDSKGDLNTAKNHPLSFILVKGYGSINSKPNKNYENFSKLIIDDFTKIELIK